LPNNLCQELIPPARNLDVFGWQISRQKALWFFVIALLVTIAVGSWLRGVPLSPPPARDGQVILLAFLLQFLAAWGVFWLVGMSLLQTLALRQRIAHSRDLLQERFEAFQNSQFNEDLQSDEAAQTSQRFERLLEQGRQVVEWAEGASSKSSNALLLPAAMLLLFSISRLPIFDGWHVNSIVLSIILVPFSLTLIGAYLVRRAAHSLRDMVVDVLDHTRLESLKTPTNSLNMKCVDGVTAKLKGLSGGAFRDYLHDPILGSFLLFMSTALTGLGKDIVGYFARMIGLR
jgi:ABC-type multidrug transport system fused ATPase/permease subunit